MIIYYNYKKMDLVNIFLTFFDLIISSVSRINIKEIEFERPIALFLIILPVIWFFFYKIFLKYKKCKYFYSVQTFRGITK